MHRRHAWATVSGLAMPALTKDHGSPMPKYPIACRTNATFFGAVSGDALHLRSMEDLGTPTGRQTYRHGRLSRMGGVRLTPVNDVEDDSGVGMPVLRILRGPHVLEQTASHRLAVCFQLVCVVSGYVPAVTGVRASADGMDSDTFLQVGRSPEIVLGRKVALRGAMVYR